MTRNEAVDICLNHITGPFEGGGKPKWNNLTNNFDGFGPSCGILQFAWGTGSLQPLLKSLDLNKYFTQEQVRQLSLRMSLDSVEAQKHWATQTIFDYNGHFLPEWKIGWQNLCNSDEFKVAQETIGVIRFVERADELVRWFGINTLRSFALAFEIVVQNGGIKSSIKKEIEEQRLIIRPIPSNKTWMKLIVDIRLKYVNPKWQSDVRSRKYAVIDGSGMVHGDVYNFSELNLEQEYIPS